MLLSIAAAVFVLSVLIIAHEAGHFFIARRVGVRVLRFSLGYPPKIFAIRGRETEYAIGATPLGGYVRMLGEEVADELGPEDYKIFLRELGRDIVAEARRRGFRPNAPNDEDSTLVQLSRRLAASAGAEAADRGTSTGSIAESRPRLAWQDGAGSPSSETPDERAILGRTLEPHERALVEEIAARGAVETALNFLATNPPPEIVSAIRRKAFPSQPLGRRIAIVMAGPATNILLVPFLLFLVFMYGRPVLLPIVGQVEDGMPAARAGIQPGDRIVDINGRRVHSWVELSKVIRESGGTELTFRIKRQIGDKITEVRLSLVPVRAKAENGSATDQSRWVVGILPRGDTITERFGPFRAAYEAMLESLRLGAALMVGLGHIIAGDTPVRDALGGPIIIARIAGEQAHHGLANLGMFMAMLSLELGILNLFPIPMLDGGHLLFFAIEAVRGKPLKLRHREIAQQVGFVLLVVLMAFVIINDLTRLTQG